MNTKILEFKNEKYNILRFKTAYTMNNKNSINSMLT
jgi:hypothetical protein